MAARKLTARVRWIALNVVAIVAIARCDANAFSPRPPVGVEAARGLGHSGLGQSALAQSGPGNSELAQSGKSPAKEAPSSPSVLTAETQKKETAEYNLSPEKYAQAIAYSRAGYRLYFIGFAYGVAMLWMILRLGIARKFRDWAEVASGIRIVQLSIFVGLLLAAIGVAKLPLRIYGHWLALSYGQSVQGWESWLWDWGKERIISVVLVTIVAWILYAMIRRSPRRWWFYFWLATIPLGLVLVFVTPLVIDPLFNEFTPLEKSHPELVAAIEKVVQRTGMNIPRERMFLMQASKKTNEINAYVTGIGASKRVVVWDNTIRDTSLDETLFIFGHEMGHYVLHHIRKGFVLSVIFLFVLLFAGFHALHWTLGRWGGDWGIYGTEDMATLPVLLLLSSVAMFLCSPIVNGYSRYEEHQADVYGLEAIHGIVRNSPEVAAHAFQVLGEIDLEDPNPPAFVAFWLYSHPPVGERLAFAHSYDPWSKGESPRYVK